MNAAKNPYALNAPVVISPCLFWYIAINNSADPISINVVSTKKEDVNKRRGYQKIKYTKLKI